MQVIATFYRFGHGIDFIDSAIKWPQKIYLYLLPIMVFGDFISGYDLNTILWNSVQIVYRIIFYDLY